MAKINRRAEEFKDLHDALQRNLQTYLPLAMDAIAGVYQKVKASNVPDASRQMVCDQFLSIVAFLTPFGIDTRSAEEEIAFFDGVCWDAALSPIS